jgi:4-amino-4-deoxy-L-arabinose transferase-like glycosyltransferase
MKPYLLLAVIVFAGVVPFSSRAVYMDEHIFLGIAQNARSNWLYPHDTGGLFFGTPVKNFVASTHPPVGEYCLALIHSLLGAFSEIPFRLLFSVFSIVAVLSFYFLARRFTDQPFLVATLFAISPAFFVMSPTLMMDIPMLAFLLLGFAFYFSHRDGYPHCLPAAGAAFALSAGTGYTVLVPLFCLFLLVLAEKRQWAELLAVAAAPIALTAWLTLMSIHFHEVPILRTVAYFATQGSVLHNVAATFSFLGGVLLFPWLPAFITEVPRKSAAVGLCLCGSGVFAALAVRPTAYDRLWYIALGSSGIFLLAAFFHAAKQIVTAQRKKGEPLLILWVPAVLLFFILAADMINARYILLAAPPLYLVLLGHAKQRNLIMAIVPTAVLSIILAYADFDFVNSYRGWVVRNIVPLQKQGFRIWSASESGLRFYLESQGISSLSTTDLRPSGVDLVVRPIGLFRYSLSEDVETMFTVLKRFPLTSKFPVRTFNLEAGAGFHDSRVGLVPFIFSRAPLDRLEIVQVSPLVSSLPQRGVPGKDIPAWSPQGVILRQEEAERAFPVKVPAKSSLEYEIEGEGTAEITNTGILLKKVGPGSVLWRSVRLVPSW